MEERSMRRIEKEKCNMNSQTKKEFGFRNRIFVFVVILFFASCHGYLKDTNYSEDVIKALKEAKKNKTELLKVIKHYETESMKLKAAFYLIENMEGHYYAKAKLVDKKGKKIDFNVLDYPDYKALKEELKKIEKEKGDLRFKRDFILYDLKTIKADFLIQQIDYAFKAWKEKTWARNYSFDLFCKYILPFRGSNEPLEEWRKYFFEKYNGIEEKMKDPTDLIEVTSLINDDVRSWFKFDPRFYVHPTDQGLSEMLKNKMGRCEDMTNLTIYALRANGIAVTSDYTPYWANTGNNHAWNAIVFLDGIAIPFMGAEANPGKYRLSNKLAKAYRKMFGKEKANLVFQKRKQKHIPPWLAGKNYLDVTSNYVDVCDVQYDFKKGIPKKCDIGFICVFNSGKWKAIHWGKIVENKTIFTDMGKEDILYLLALYIKKKIKPFGTPFILHKDEGIEELKADVNHKISIEVASTTRRKQLTSTDGIARSFLKNGKEYELFYWNDDWKSIDKKTATDKPLTFDNIPSNALYRLVEKDSDKEERPFTIDKNGIQVFW
jgi:hypothetical protein